MIQMTHESTCVRLAMDGRHSSHIRRSIDCTNVAATTKHGLWHRLPSYPSCRVFIRFNC